MSIADDILKRIDINTGVDVNYKEVTTGYSGAPLTVSDLDGDIFREKDGVYYQKQIDPKTLLKINTIDDLRLQNGYYTGQEIVLLGYYESGDKNPVTYKFTHIQDVDNGGSIINSTKGSWIAQFGDTVDLRDFGAKASTTEDSTSVFQKVIDLYQGQRKKITMGKKDIKISNQIDITNNPNLKDIRIWYSNNDVDGLGNASKCVMYLNATSYGTLSELALDNIKVFVTGTPPPNQHVLILEGEGLAQWKMFDIYAEYYSGSLIYLKGTGSANHPEFYQIDWRNILMTSGGGFISQSDVNTDVWVVGGTVDNIDIEHGINQVSPQEITANFKGFRNVNFSNLTFQGGTANGVDKMIYTNRDVSLSNVWMEFQTNQPPLYWHNEGGISSGKNLFGINNSCKIKSTGKLSILKLNDIFLYDDTNACFESELGGKINVDGIKYENYSENQDNSNKRAFSNLSSLGNIKFNNISSFSGGGYSVDDKIVLFKHKPGNLIKSNAEYQLSDNVYFGSDNLVITTKDGGQEGRLLSLKTLSGTGFPNGYFLINKLARFAGSSAVIAIRMQVNVASTSGSLFWTPALRNDNQGVLLDGGGNAVVDYINGYRRFNQMYTCYLSISELTGSNLYVYLAPQSNDVTGDCEVLISDIEILIGDKLPQLKGSGAVNRELEFDSEPTTGVWNKGDIIYNTNPSAGNPVYWICITSGEFGVSSPVFDSITL